jgi:hypothetical protein
MPRNGSGLYTLPYDWEDDDANDIPIRSDRMQEQNQDQADALTQSLTKDGQTTPTANIPLGGFKLTNVGPATVRTDAVNLGQIQDSTNNYVAVTGTSAYVGSLSPGLSAYVDGQSVLVAFLSANTGANPSINFNSLGALSLVYNGSSTLAPAQIANAMRGQVVIDAANARAHLIPSKISLGFEAYNTTDTAVSITATPNTFYRVTSGPCTITLGTLTTNQVVGIARDTLSGDVTVARSAQTIDGVADDDTLGADVNKTIFLYLCTGTGTVVTRAIGVLPT